MLRPKLTFPNSKTRLSSPSLAISWLNKILTTKKEREKKDMISLLSTQKKQRTMTRSFGDEDNDAQWRKRSVHVQCPKGKVFQASSMPNTSLMFNNNKG